MAIFFQGQAHAAIVATYTGTPFVDPLTGSPYIDPFIGFSATDIISGSVVADTLSDLSAGNFQSFSFTGGSVAIDSSNATSTEIDFTVTDGVITEWVVRIFKLYAVSEGKWEDAIYTRNTLSDTLYEEVHSRGVLGLTGRTSVQAFQNQHRGAIPGEWVITETIQPVPLPAAAWLFISALGVVGYMGWRKKKA